MYTSFVIQALLGLLFFSALLTTGASLQCDSCEASAATCTATKVNCTKDEDICASITTEKTVESKNVTSIKKSCSKKAECQAEKAKVGKTESGIKYIAVECSKASLRTASFLLVLSGLPLIKLLL